MLVLQRKDGERIRIGDDIIVVVKDIKDGRVKVCIEAPRDVRVLRAEVQRKAG